VISRPFGFEAPRSLAEVLDLLADNPGGTKLLAGGMSLLPAMNLGLAAPEQIVSLNGLDDLATIREADGKLRLGAMVAHHELASDQRVAAWCPLLREAAASVGDVQVRNRGTIGGVVAHADPAADYLPVLVAAEAEIVLESRRGARIAAARDFFIGLMLTALKPDEVVTEVAIPRQSSSAGSSYLRLARVEGNYAIVNAAAIVSHDHTVISVGGQSGRPALVELEAAPDPDKTNGDEIYGEIAARVREACSDAYGDRSGTADYRRAMAELYAVRAATKATERRAGQ
jgi:aerobic carbon-monoxide dehydrogenase medium subunit